MSQIGQPERFTQNRVIKFFQEKLGYEYLGNWQDRENSNIEEETLRSFLNSQKYGKTLIDRAISEFVKTATNQTKELYYINKDVYSLLRYGVQVKDDIGDNHQPVRLINWKEPEKNHFAIAEEVSITGKNNKRPDIVLYVNGIALGVLELKRSIVSVEEGIRQNLDNQSNRFIRHFFNTVQIIMAGNDPQGIKYGVIETKERYYLEWKEDSKIENRLEKHLTQICLKERFLELIHDFIVYDNGIKKLCRHNQYFGVKAAQERIKKREGGIIWHTQGSGKSLTMVWIAKWIRENANDSRVLVITDREELDEQIEKVFKGVDESIYRTKSGKDLIEKLNTKSEWLLCSLIHKFGRNAGADYGHFIDEINQYIPKDFEAKGNMFVFVDECHRTQSGELHKAMKKLLPNALFIGFTGTPLLKKDKKKSIEIFGSYIHTYKFDEAVKDEVIVDLVYEARYIEQNVTSQERIDQWFDLKTRGLSQYALNKLKQRWVSLKQLYSSKSRLEKIVADIMLDFERIDRLESGRGNALLVAGSIYEACKFYELFQEKGFKRCAIITSYDPSINSIKGESVSIDEEETEAITKYEIYQKMLSGRKAEEFEKEVKKKFINEPAQMKLLIVVDKLLTGFDAPPATYLYIDKSMQDHGLFQAICRVNRMDSDDKQYGYVVDYKDLFKSLERSINNYTGGAFSDYDKDDVSGLLKNRLQVGKERLDTALEKIRALCEHVDYPKDSPAYYRYFSGNNDEDLKATEEKRHALYKYNTSLVRAYADLANEMEEAGYNKKEIERIKNDVEHYNKAGIEIMHHSGDYIELKAYAPAMRHLIDSYIDAKESITVSGFEDLGLVEIIINSGISQAINRLPSGISKSKNATAETIENSVRRVITDHQPLNPKYYEKMSVLLAELVALRKKEAIDYKEYLKRLEELVRKIIHPTANEYPLSLNTNAKRALYDNLNKDEKLVINLDREIVNIKKDDWRGNKIKEREVINAIKKHVTDETLIDSIFELVKKQSDY